MFKSVALLNLSIILLFASPIKGLAQNAPSPKLSYTFTLASQSTTSAGVFKPDGTLIKTLWSGVTYSAGAHSANWDGKLDNDSIAADGSYEIKVTSNNIKAEWGIIGNTSKATSGVTVNHSADVTTSMTFAGNYSYYSVGYNEGHASHFKVKVSDPQVKIDYLPGQGQITLFEATDGVRVYHAGQGVPTTMGHIFATRVSDDSMVLFNSGIGIQVQNGRHLPSVIDTATTSMTTGDPNAGNIPECPIGGMTVQKTGKYLFVSHFDRNDIKVYDVHTIINGKPSGALIQTISSFINAKSMCVDADDDNSIWIVSGTNTVAKYTINANGTLTSATLTLSGLVTPLAVTCKSGKVAVADGSTRQQVRIFNNLNGIEGVPLGQLGGYSTDATVANDKFMFKNTKELFRGERNTWIAYGLDGSMWVGDRGNYRVQHFSATNTFIETIMNLGYFYSTFSDKNKPSRVFANYLEFDVDYSKPLEPNNGSWTLVKNWAYPITYNFDDVFNRLRGVTTLSNGRTYAFIPHVSLNGNSNRHRWHVVELPSIGNLRFTGIEPEFTHGQFDVFFALNSDGSLFRINNTELSLPASWIKNSLTGFDNSGNPIWGADEILASIPMITSSDPITANGVMADQVTSTGKIISFNPDRANEISGRGGGYHLGAVAVGDNKWLWRTSTSTNSQYIGDLPSDGSFDVANGVIYAGGFMMATDSLIVWNYHGENWKGTQTNMWNLYSDKGMLLLQFGTTGIDANYQGEATPEMAGNTISGTLSKLPNGDFILIGNDESYHGAIQVWRIKGVNTIKEQTINIIKNGTPTDSLPDYVDLMAGLPFNGTVLDGTYGWTRYPVEESLNGFNNMWSLTTNRTTFKQTDKDLFITSIPPGNNLTQWVKRDLGTNTGLPYWRIDGQLFYPLLSEVAENFIDVLDKNNKVIVRIRPLFQDLNFAIKANNSILIQDSIKNLHAVINKLQPFSITVKGANAVTVTYANFPPVNTSLLDSSADWQNPKTLRFQMHNDDTRGHQIDVANLRFHKNPNANYSYFRTDSSGNWKDIKCWQSSSDSISWKDATIAPDTTASTVTIQNGNTITITDSATVDQLIIQNGGVLNVASKSSLTVNDGPGDDILIYPSGNLIIKSDSSGTGRIANSTGNIKGNATVERYISSSSLKSYRLLSPSVNTVNSIRPFIRDNWQEGQNNINTKTNSNLFPRYGIHITGSIVGANGFDATSKGTASLFTYNPTNLEPSWIQTANTNATSLDAKNGYLVIIFGDRATDLRTSTASSSTTLRATGTIATGTQTFAKPAGDRGTILVGNPYPSPINWSTIYNDASTSNLKNFENYYTYWEPRIGTGGGYVTVNSNGVKSAPTNATTEIQSGQAFLIRPKKGILSPTLTVKESHKSVASNLNVFRVAPQEQLMSILYYTDDEGRKILADAVNTVFDDAFSGLVNDNDAEEMANSDENIAILRDGRMLSIEERPIIKSTDTLPLIIQRLKVQAYEWEFNPTAFSDNNLDAFLDDNFLHTRIPISLTDITTFKFAVSDDLTSSAQDRFKIVFASKEVQPVNISSIKAYPQTSGIQVNWTNQYETLIDRYEVEKSSDGHEFKTIGTIQPMEKYASIQNYSLFDAHSQDGNNYYRIKLIDTLGASRYTEVVNVKIIGSNGSISVFPNPITSDYSIIQFTNIPKGIYLVKLINDKGQLILKRNINHNGGSMSQTIPVNANLPSGIYTLQVTGNDIYFTKKLLK